MKLIELLRFLDGYTTEFLWTLGTIIGSIYAWYILRTDKVSKSIKFLIVLTWFMVALKFVSRILLTWFRL